MKYPTIDDVLDRIENEVCTLSCGLSGLGQLTKQDDDADISDLFNLLAKSAGDIVGTIEYLRDELKADNEASLDGENLVTHDQEQLPEVTAHDAD